MRKRKSRSISREKEHEKKIKKEDFERRRENVRQREREEEDAIDYGDGINYTTGEPIDDIFESHPNTSSSLLDRLAPITPTPYRASSSHATTSTSSPSSFSGIPTGPRNSKQKPIQLPRAEVDRQK